MRSFPIFSEGVEIVNSVKSPSPVLPLPFFFIMARAHNDHMRGQALFFGNVRMLLSRTFFSYRGAGRGSVPGSWLPFARSSCNRQHFFLMVAGFSSKTPMRPSSAKIQLRQDFHDLFRTPFDDFESLEFNPMAEYVLMPDCEDLNF